MKTSGRGSSLKVTEQKREKWLTIRPEGRLDAEGASVVSQAVETAVGHGWRFIELDMGGVDYLSSGGIRVLLLQRQKIGRLKGAFFLTSVQERVEKILEMVGLYELLLPPEELTNPTGQNPVAAMEFANWTLHKFVLDDSGVLTSRLTGEPCAGDVQDAGIERCEVLPFPASTVSVGIGALGYDAADCRGRRGAFIAAGGIAACKPAAAGLAADYVAYAEEYIPRLHASSGLSLRGSFSHLISFESRQGGSIAFSDLACAVLGILDKPVAGLVLAAETEKHVILAGGVIKTPGESTMHGWLTPWNGDDSFSCHIHAAFFPYQPIRLGFVKLKETIVGLFENELLNVIHVKPPGKTSLHESIVMLRGVAWLSEVCP